MKILILLAIFCAVSFAAFLPIEPIDTSIQLKFNTTRSDYLFKVTWVAIESPLVRGQYNSLEVCAINSLSSQDAFTGASYEIGANYGSLANNTIYATGFQSSDNSSSHVCQYYGFRVPPFAENSLYARLSFSATENRMSEIVVNLPL